MSLFTFSLLLLVLACDPGYCVLKLSTYFGDHMVLQRGPQQAVLWGTADTEGDTVTVKVIGQGSDTATVTTAVKNRQWKVKLPAKTAKGPYVIDVSSKDGHLKLNDVLFGDIWLCSGQSNMYFTLNQVLNATAELQNALQFPEIRFTRAKLVESATPLDSMAFDIPWAVPSSSQLRQTSAVCWLFAEYLYPKVKYPIGLIQTSWGGTPIEAWSPPEVFTDCSGSGKKRAPGDRSALWNAMIHPILSTTIYGALWYQGEANAGRAASYTCQIQAMVKEWRTKFHQESLQQTSSSFPFGYVQLAGNAHNNDVGSFPGERWAQTANYGYSPNPALPDTFMAVAMDLPDFTSPSGTIHPRHKQDVAKRLVLGALNVAYGHKDVVFQGPFPTDLTLSTQNTLDIEYDHGQVELTINNNQSFEVCCSESGGTKCDDAHDKWVAAPISGHRTGHVTLNTSGCAARKVVGVRYAWRTSPCELKQCSVYATVSGLPAPPYISHSATEVNQGPEIIG